MMLVMASTNGERPMVNVEQALENAMGEVATRQDAWIDAELRRIAPELADVPARVDRFLANVQRMLVSSGLEARRCAAEVTREAEEVAVLRSEWAAARARIAATVLPSELRVSAGRQGDEVPGLTLGTFEGRPVKARYL